MLKKTPQLLQKLFPEVLCRIAGEGKVVYLTFDDGPTPGVTDEVLEVLEQYDAKATFFCLGKQVALHPELYTRVQTASHRIGNHGFAHLDGLLTPKDVYLKDVDQAEALIQSDIFRPAYGRLRPAQYKALKQRYQIVLWDVMPADFDTNLSAEDCYKTILQHVQPGSIIVLHDSAKAWPRLREILPRFLQEFAAKGYTFAALPMF